MNNLFKKVGLSVALAATTLTVAAPAEAQRYRRYDRGRGDVATGAIVGGIVGLGLGAAIASSSRDRYYDRGYRGYRGDYYGPRGYYRDRYYAPRRFRGPRGYYAPQGYYAPRGYYGGRGYGGRGYGNGYGYGY